MALISRLFAVMAAIATMAIAVPVLVVFGPGMPPARAATHAITMAHYAFGPAQLTVRVGDSITWTNTDTAPHDVTTTNAPLAIHSPTITTGQSWSYTFTVPGTYEYICSIHPDMQATVTVEPAAPVTHAPSPRASVVASAPPANVATSNPVTKVPSAATVAAVGTKPRSNAVANASSAANQPASAVAATNAQATSTTSGSRLKPLLLVAGLIAAVATLCLLILASTPRGDT